MITRRTFARLGAAVAGTAAPALMAVSAAAAQSSTRAEESDKLQSEFLLDFALEKGPASTVGSPVGNRVVVAVAGGTFEGPKLKGTIIGPSGDWILVRPDGSSVLDLRLLLQTDDSQKILMASRGIAYTPPGGALHARILSTFETGAAKYAWLNNVLAVGVHRPMPEKVAYRVYQVL